MEQEIDLRPYAKALVSHWMWIAGAAIVLALIALGISFLGEPTYEATALVALTNPRQIVQLDPRIKPTDENQPYKAFPELATSDDLLISLLNEVQPTTPGVKNLAELRGIISAQPGSDPSLLRLSVQYRDAQKAAEISNIWASLFVSKANEVFGIQGDQQLEYFQSQLAIAAQKLEISEKAVVDFQAHNRSDILASELAAFQTTQADQLSKKREIASILQDVKSLQDQLENSTSDNDFSSTNQLAAMLLQLRAFSGVSTADVVAPWQIQVNVDQIVESGPGEQLAFSKDLETTLVAQSAQIERDLADLEPQILALQQEKKDEEVEASRLGRDLKIAEDTYSVLALKVEEEKITSQNFGSGVRLASQSAVPEMPSGQSKLLIVAIGLILGAIISMGFIIIITWWRA